MYNYEYSYCFDLLFHSRFYYKVLIHTLSTQNLLFAISGVNIYAQSFSFFFRFLSLTKYLLFHKIDVSQSLYCTTLPFSLKRFRARSLVKNVTRRLRIYLGPDRRSQFCIRLLSRRTHVLAYTQIGFTQILLYYSFPLTPFYSHL